ncbi:MAG: hypothetical protein ACK4N5_10200, partial [Myxococcales bacterium]
AERLVVLSKGKVVADGAPRALYDAPPTLGVATLLGELSALPGGDDGSWIRPERLRPADDGEEVRVQGVAHVAGGVELTGVDRSGRPILLHLNAPPALNGDRLRVGWSPGDVLRLGTD